MDNEQIEILATRISFSRLSSFLEITSGDISRAISLYQWNAQLSAAVFEILGHLEIVFRNAIDRELSHWNHSRFGSTHWFENQHGFLLPKAINDVHIAKQRLQRRHFSITRDGIVAELNFGFWRFLLAKQYKTTLWTAAIKFAFPNLQPSNYEEIARRVSALHELRNRVAHHEPIHKRRIEVDLERVQFIASAVGEETEKWILANSRVAAILRNRPT